MFANQDNAKLPFGHPLISLAQVTRATKLIGFFATVLLDQFGNELSRVIKELTGRVPGQVPGDYG